MVNTVLNQAFQYFSIHNEITLIELKLSQYEIVPIMIMRKYCSRICCLIICLFVCVKVLWPSQPNGVMSSMVSLPNHTFTGQAWSSKQLTSIVHILLSETDNCPS